MANIRSKNNSPRLRQDAFTISMLSDPTRSGRRDVLLDGRLQVISWKGVNSAGRLLLEAAAQTPGTRIVAAMTPSAMPALALAALRPGTTIDYFHMDLFNAISARNLMARHGMSEAFQVHCAPLMPDTDPAPDLVLVNLRMDDETALSLELLHQARHRLAVGGKLLVAVNNPNDTWVATQLDKIFGNLTRVGRDRRAIVYSVKKRASTQAMDAEDRLRREHFIMNVAVEFDGETVPFETCYGTFNPYKLDDGSGALLNELKPPTPCTRILDLGCGWGGLGILAARRTGASELLMIDANARAVEMARRNLLRLGPIGGEVRLEANVESLQDPALHGHFDLVVTNPPYGTEFRVTELFLNAAHKALRPGGRVFVVAKNNQRLLLRAGEIFGHADETRRWGYQVVSATKNE